MKIYFIWFVIETTANSGVLTCWKKRGRAYIASIKSKKKSNLKWLKGDNDWEKEKKVK